MTIQDQSFPVLPAEISSVAGGNPHANAAIDQRIGMEELETARRAARISRYPSGQASKDGGDMQTGLAILRRRGLVAMRTWLALYP